jgi:hypothetical protein
MGAWAWKDRQRHAYIPGLLHKPIEVDGGVRDYTGSATPHPRESLPKTRSQPVT